MIYHEVCCYGFVRTAEGTEPADCGRDGGPFPPDGWNVYVNVRDTENGDCPNEVLDEEFPDFASAMARAETLAVEYDTEVDYY